MKIYALLFLYLTVVNGEKKINLEDIERDNLRAEAESDQDHTRPEETKYTSSDKIEGNPQLQYHTEARLIGGQQPQELKYAVQPEAYNQVDYQQAYQQVYQQQQQHSAALVNQQQQAPQQFYNSAYQTEAVYPGQKTSHQVLYQPQLTQGFTYQNEVPIGNQIQSYQQKTATQKFSKGISKASQYSNEAATGNQQLLYYPEVSSSSKNQAQPLLHRLAHEASRTVPAYTTTVSQGPKIAYQVQPEVQYVYEPQYVPATRPAAYVQQKNHQKYAYAAPAVQRTYPSQRAYSAGITHNQQSSLYAQPKLAHTQAYYIQPQLTRYYQEPAYTPALQGNALAYIQPHSQPQSVYIPSNLASQYQPQSQYLEQHGSHSIAQNYAKIPQEQNYVVTLPQASIQHYKTGPITQLQPIHSGISHTSNELYYSSGPKSLLDSYVPSHVIAAQDSDRYRERPLHLESGFLPSKGSYGHSHNQKRKSQ